MQRCKWVNLQNNLYVNYHDNEWGVPVYDDRQLFEMLILEGAQAGLSWETVLNKRNEYKKVFYNFNIDELICLSDSYYESLLNNNGIIRNKLKIMSVKSNAIVFKSIQEEFGSFSSYIWGFTNKLSMKNVFETIEEYPKTNIISDQISLDLKKRGMKFVGSTIIYAFMQAVGITNDHMKCCYLAAIK